MDKKRSVGVTILAVLFILGGIFNMLSGLFYISGAGMTKPQFSVSQYKDFFLKANPNMPPEEIEKLEKDAAPFMENMVQAQNEIVNSGFFNIYIILNSLLGLAGLILGVGLFRLKEYARKGMIVFILLSVPIMLILNYVGMRKMIRITAKYMPQIAQGPVDMLSTVPIMVGIQGVFAIGISLLIAYYLTRSKVREQFKWQAKN